MPTSRMSCRHDSVWDKVLQEEICTYLGSERVDDLAGEGFCELEDEDDGELCPWQGRGFLFLLLGEQGSLFVSGRGGHE